MEILENDPFPGPFSATNASSTSKHQANKESIINNGGKSDSAEEDLAKSHAENSSSNGFLLLDDHSLVPESPLVPTTERDFSFFSDENNPFAANDSELLVLQKDEFPKDSLEKNSEEKTMRDDLNVFAVERDAQHLDTVPSVASQIVDSLGDARSHNEETLVSSPSTRQNDKSDVIYSHDDTAFDSSPRVEENDPFKNSFPPSPSVLRGTGPSVDSPKTGESVAKRIQIDTAAPFESVKHAVSKFGGILDWKAHRAHTMEKRQIIEQELERAHHEIPLFKKLCEGAEDSKRKILKDLDGIKRLIEEMKIHLEKVQTEELQAKQDAELVKLRVEEMEQGIAGDASVAAKAQLEVAKARYAAAITELKAVKDELEALRHDYALLKTERDASVIKAQEAVSASRKVEKQVEDLTIELMTVKESLETAHAAHLESDEHRSIVIEARKQDALNWEEAVHQAEEELERLNQKFTSKKEIRSKLDSTSALLKDLKAELAAYMQSKPKQGTDEDGNFDEQENRTRAGIQAAVDSARKELNEVKMNIGKATGEVDCLQVAATSLKIEVEREKAELGTISQKEGTASIAVATHEAELRLMQSKIANVQMEEKAAREKMVELDKQLEHGAQEAEEATIVVQVIHEKVSTAKEEAEQAKAGARNMESRLLLAQKEIEAAKATEKLALAAISAMHECESARSIKDDDTPTGVNLSLEQYYELSKQAHDAEEEANSMVTAAISQIDVAKESELRNLSKLEELGREISEERSALQIALEKAEKAKEAKMEVEQELRQWRAEHEQKRKAMDPPSNSPRASFGDDKETNNFDRDPDDPMLHQKLSPKAYLSESKTLTEPSHEVHPTKKKKKSFFPRFLLFFAKKKAQSKKE